ncbi:aldo/keto reductase, partial [Arthrobacter deserti]|nr:aldo/keto reductase [Arthrobacter deserti]
HGATPAQIVLAWHLALGNIAIPKTVTPARMVENLAAVEIRLSPDEVAAGSALESGNRIGPDPAVVTASQL